MQWDLTALSHATIYNTCSASVWLRFGVKAPGLHKEASGPNQGFYGETGFPLTWKFREFCLWSRKNSMYYQIVPLLL